MHIAFVQVANISEFTFSNTPLMVVVVLCLQGLDSVTQLLFICCTCRLHFQFH